jgi:dienelactone hydrolase
VLGDGDRGVLLVPQSGGDICQWLPTGRRLAAEGYLVGLMDWTSPFDTAVTTAAGLLRDAGATELVMVGASRGGAYVLGVAGTLRPAPAGVVSFSGEGRLGEWDADARIRSYRGPLLLLGSEDDFYTPAGVTRVPAENHPGPETVLITPGDLHGVELLTGPDADQITAAFDQFLTRTLPR